MHPLRAAPWFPLALTVLAGACTPLDAPPEPDSQPATRPGDGLLDRPELQALVELQQARDGTALTERLGDLDPRIRARAAFALASVQDTTAVPALLELLDDPVPEVRADAAFALGQVAVDDAGRVFLEALAAEEDVEVRSRLVEALGKSCEVSAIPGLLEMDDPALAGAVTLALGRCVLTHSGETDIWERLASDLRSDDPEVRWWAAYPFGRSGTPGVWRGQRGAVREALRSYRADEPAAMHLVRGLGRMGDRASWRELEWWLRNGALWETRVNAAEALARFEHMAPRVGLAFGTGDASVHVRVQSLQGLVDGPPPPGLMEFMRAGFDPGNEDLATAPFYLGFLGRAGDAEAVEAWFQRPDIREDATLLAGIQGAAALEGARGVELLRDAVLLGSRRTSRLALGELEERWEISQGAPEAHALFREVFEEVAASSDPALAQAARTALREPPLGGGTGDTAASTGAPATARSRPPVRAVDWERLQRLGTHPRWVLETNRGRIVLTLSTEEAPLTVDGITFLAETGRYDGVPFHRVVPNFVAQGGDVTRSGREEGAGFLLRSEFTRIPYGRGTLGMASAGKDTETSQFFVTHSAQPHLDGGYTAFGWVEEGMDVLDRIAPEDVVIRSWVRPGWD